MQGIQILLRGARKTVLSYYLSTLWKPQRRDPAQLRRKRVKRVSETWCTAAYSPFRRQLSSLRGRDSAMDAGLRIRRGFESSPVNSPHVFLRFVWSLARSSNPHAMRARTNCQTSRKRISGFEGVRSQWAKHAAGREKRTPASIVWFFVAAPPPSRDPRKDLKATSERNGKTASPVCIQKSEPPADNLGPASSRINIQCEHVSQT